MCPSIISPKDDPSIGIIYRPQSSKTPIIVSILTGIINRSWPTKSTIMMSLCLIGFRFMSGRIFCVPDHLTFDLMASESNRIIFVSWPTKTLITGSLSSICLMLLRGQFFMFNVTVTFDPLTPKSIGTWSLMILRNYYLDKISLKIMKGQDFANDGRTTVAIT